jgi:hypothetical protein
MDVSLESCHTILNNIGNLLNAHRAIVADFHGCFTSICERKSFLSLRDLERVIAPTPRSVSIARMQRVGGEVFGLISPYGESTSAARSIDSLKALWPVADGNNNGLLMLAENYLAHFDGTYGLQRTIIAGSYSQGNAGVSRQQSRLKNPESVCTFRFTNGQTVEYVSRTLNNLAAAS